MLVITARQFRSSLSDRYRGQSAPQYCNDRAVAEFAVPNFFISARCRLVFAGAGLLRLELSNG